MSSSSISYQKYLITGHESCQCLNWRECRWSKLAVLAVKDMAKESEDFKQVQKILRQNVCGDDPEDHFVNCCGPDQKPSEIDTFIDGKFQVVLMKFGQIDYNNVCFIKI